MNSRSARKLKKMYKIYSRDQAFFNFGVKRSLKEKEMKNDKMPGIDHEIYIDVVSGVTDICAMFPAELIDFESNKFWVAVETESKKLLKTFQFLENNTNDQFRYIFLNSYARDVTNIAGGAAFEYSVNVDEKERHRRCAEIMKRLNTFFKETYP